MKRGRVEGFSIGFDGYASGPNQDISDPPGVGGTARRGDLPDQPNHGVRAKRPDV